MVNTFQLNKKYGEWAENTIYQYFKSVKDKLGIDIFYYGSQVSTRKKDYTDAPIRPDFILLKKEDLERIETKYSLNFNKINLKNLFNLVNISDENKRFLEENPHFWMTKVLDKEDLMQDIVKNVHCMIEIKSGFGLFDQTKYEQERVNVMVPINFRERLNLIKQKFKKHFKTYAIYLLLDKAYIANVDTMFKEGLVTQYSYERIGKSDVKKSSFQTLSFKKSHFFADIEGIVIRSENVLKLNEKNAKPIIEIINGTVTFSLDMKPGILKNVNINIIQNLAD